MPDPYLFGAAYQNLRCPSRFKGEKAHRDHKISGPRGAQDEFTLAAIAQNLTSRRLVQ